MRLAIVALLLFAVTDIASAEEIGTGLEMPPGTRLDVAVEKPNADAKKIGLSEQLIRSKVELQLRRNGVEVGTKEDYLKSKAYFYVRCTVVGESYNIVIRLNRRVSYTVGDKTYVINATTYNKSSTGTVGSSGGDFVIKHLLNYIDEFSNDFIKANQAK